MEPGAVAALVVGYIATVFGVLLLYSPLIILAVGLLLTAGLLQLLAWPFLALIHKWRRKPDPPQDGSWLFH
ncbi:MAG: hypothetical protein JWR71_172 [Pseudarthrobacter sp.]|nr:hypothetical protein [Pseudarthrobacter sp.]